MEKSKIDSRCDSHFNNYAFNISITKVQPPLVVSLTTISHQKDVSKDFAYSEKFIK